MARNDGQKQAEGDNVVSLPAEAVGKLLSSVDALAFRAEGRAAMPDPDAFKATPDTYVVDHNGDKWRHGHLPDGKAQLIGNVRDDKN